MSKYGVLLVGGRRTHQEMQAATFAAHPLCRLVAVADEREIPEPRAELNRQFAQASGLPYIPDLDQALSRDDIHIVSSTPEIERRARVAVSCLEAGKHMYLDTQLAGTLEGAEAIVAAAEQAGVRTQMFSSIHADWAQAAKRAVTEGRIGELKAVHAENLFAKGRAGTVPEGTVRHEKERVERFTFIEGKREMYAVGVYSLGLVHWLTGRKVESVFCVTGNYFHAEHARLDIEDFGALALTLEGGVTATAIGGRFGWMSHPGSGQQRLVLIGTEGTLTVDANRPRIELYNDEPDFTPPPVHPQDPMAMWSSTFQDSPAMPKQRWVGLNEGRDRMTEDVAAFIDCIEEGREPEMNARAGASAVEVILAGYASAARGEAVRLPLPRD